VAPQAILVTGGGGFIGCGIVRRLLARGAAVHVLLRPQAVPWRLEGFLDQVTVHRVDVLDAGGVRDAVGRIAPAAVFHMATHGAYEVQSDARRILETNIVGSYNVLEASVAAGVAVFVNAGSSSEYGLKREPMREAERLEPNSVYAVAKAAQTHLASLVASRGPTAVVTFRLFSVYGPWEEPTRLMPTLIRRARAGLPLEMAAPDTARDFVYVEDVLDALVDIDRLTAATGEIFNLGTGVQSRLRDVVAAVQAAVGGNSEVRWGGMPPRHWDTDMWQADVSKARAVLGWSPKHTLAEGVARMAAWMAATGNDHVRA
jgi:nucleoside-diphosphate-sugar epimerase